MSGLAIVPLSRDAGMADVTRMPLLTDQSTRAEKAYPQTAAPQRQEIRSGSWNGDLNHYQAQVIGAELAKSYGRHQSKASPRSAARAYAQSRRRPEATANQPRLQAVM